MVTTVLSICHLVIAQRASLPHPAFSVVWNGPSAGCRNPSLSLADYPEIFVNTNQSFAGSVITLLYNSGEWPQLSASYNATPCWSKHVSGCSWNPWGNISVKSNGGVPQAANITRHAQKLEQIIETEISDPHSDALLIVDWEAWRPLYQENDDGLSSYKEYSARLVRADPAWAGKPEKEIQVEAQKRFDEGAKDFFTTTVQTIRKVRPQLRIGFYSQGINQDNSTGGMADNTQLLWLWDIVDVLTPSIYPRSTNATTVAESTTRAVAGAIASVELLRASREKQNKDSRSGSRPLPAVMPYARALVNRAANNTNIPFSKGILAAQVQAVAGLGAEGVILWGSSGDYHGSGCKLIEDELVAFAGSTMAKCVQNRETCAKEHCSGHGRCIDYRPDALEMTCVTKPTAADVSCRCERPFKGADCSAAEA
jgi:hypothetical protein